jgi:hypothetical protein
MVRFPFFFVIAILAIVGLIGVALLPLRPSPVVAVEARVDGDALILDGAALASLRGARGFPVTLAPGPRGDQSGPRLASISALAPDAQYSKGARLMLGPQTLAALKDKAFRVTITARGVATTPAQSMGFGLVAGGPVSWGQIAVTPTFSPLQFELAASDQPITGIAIWPAVEGRGHGIEIQSIAFQPILSNGITQ